MTKVLFILTKSGIGGAQKYVADLAKNLGKNTPPHSTSECGGKFESRILYGEKDINPVRSRPAEGGATGALGRPASNGVKWLSNKTYPWFLFVNDWLAVFELMKIFKKEQPDIVHLNSSKAGVISALASKFYSVKCQMLKLVVSPSNHVKYSSPKVVFTAHGWVFNPTNELSWVARQFFIVLHKFAAMFQDKIICVSGYDYDLALQYDICEPEKLVKIHNGIDPNMKFLLKKMAKSVILNAVKDLIDSSLLAQNDRWPWIGSIGRLVKEKNYETFIEAAALVKDAYFFIIGEGPESDYLKLKIKNLKLNDRFFIIPPIGNDAQYLKAFDIFAMSSVKEGLPYILLEAMAAELPIVITEAGGMPELIKNHENGLMVAQKNPEALARAIGGLIENKIIARELSQKAREVVAERFSLKKMVTETEKVYSFLDK